MAVTTPAPITAVSLLQCGGLAPLEDILALDKPRNDVELQSHARLLCRHFTAAHTDIEIRCGFSDTDPVIDHWRLQVPGAERGRAYTLIVVTSDSARLICLCDRTGMPYPNGLLLTDKHALREHVGYELAREVLTYLAGWHAVLRAIRF